MEEINQIPGCIFKENEEDYILGSSQTLFNIENLPDITAVIHEYNQNEFAKDYGFCLCTAYSSLGCYSDIFDKIFIEKERLNFVKYRSGLADFDKNKGGYLVEGIKAICDIQKNCLFYKIPKQQIKNIIKKGYSVNIGIYDGGDVSKARQDGKFSTEEIKNIVSANLGHSTRIVENAGTFRINSYKGVSKNNAIEIENIDDFINSWFVYQNAYFLVPNKKIKEYFENLLKNKTYKEAFNLFFDLSKTLYKKEAEILQYVLQMKYIGKINSENLKNIVF